MFSDFHVHTHFSADSEADIDLIIQTAVAKGMSHLCTTDHNDYDFPSVNGDSDFNFNLDVKNYYDSIIKYRKKYENIIDLKIGIECGLQLQTADRNEKLISSVPFDFVIGSIHVVNNFDPYYPEYFTERSDDEGFAEYFKAILDNIKAVKCFDVLGHMDYIVRYSPNKNKNYSYKKYADIIDEIIKILIENGKGIEVNTGGFAYGIGVPNPCPQIIKRYKELGGEILTVGSDSHRPSSVGRYFEQLPALLKSCGFNYYTVFKNRRPEFIKIN